MAHQTKDPAMSAASNRGTKMEEEAMKSSIAADLESEVGVVRINARRMRIHRFKNNLRRQEQLAQLGLESAPVEVAAVERQLAESHQRLEKLQDDGLEMVTNVAVAFLSRENDHRQNTRLGQQQREQRLHQDTELAQQRFNELSELWDSAVKRAPSALQSHMSSQRALCDQLLAQKDGVVASLAAELRCMDDEYNVEVATHGQDTTVLIQRMKDQLVILRNAYLRELLDIYDAMGEDLDDTRCRNDEAWQEKLDAIVAMEEKRLANYIQMNDDHDQDMSTVHQEDADEFRQVRSTLERDVELLQQHLEQLKAACLLNTEKLDYNYQVLRRRDEESTVTKSQQKRRLNKLQDTYNALRQRLSAQEYSQRAELQQLTADLSRLTDMLVDLGERNQHFVTVHSRQLHQVFQMTHERCRAQLDKVVRADKVIHEQQLGLSFTPPDLDHLEPPEIRLDSAMDVVRDTLAAGGDADTSDGRGPAAAAVLGAGSPLLRRLLLLLSDSAGFLVEEKLHRLLAEIEPSDGALLRLDAVTGALGVRTQIDLQMLCTHFVKYASPVSSEQQLSPPETPDGGVTPAGITRSSPELTVRGSGGVAGAARATRSQASVDSHGESGSDTSEAGSSSSGAAPTPQLITSDGVLRALSEFLDEHRARAGAAVSVTAPPTAASRWARAPPPPTDRQFWQRFLQVQPESQRRLWRALQTGLQSYNTVLQQRQTLREQVQELAHQNGELRRLLHAHLNRHTATS